ncbi:hypothetical protein OG206_02300 [Streptomyces sp. NBC_01341]|uniref:hypothetical protein n=1 Tax=Streptomyces sp. NBC_01341 TaxID=2903831 RepID=UPI002E0E3299|nr:hypothetical protein OG206_02300 [Streptomyces sp. NBC_01341]
MAAHSDVRVERDEDGTIRITTAAPPTGSGGPVHAHADEVEGGLDFTRAVLDVAGAVLEWPVLAVPRPPAAHVHDARRAQQWLWAFYGERVAAAVHDTMAGDGPDRILVGADATPLADSAARLALGHWAARWWPASYTDGIPVLDPDVLGLELAALTHVCQQLFDDRDDQPDDCAADLVGEHRAALDLLIRWWRAESRQTGTAERLEDVLRLIDDVADRAGLVGPDLRGLRSALDLPGPAAAPADPGPLFARKDAYALAAGEHRTGGGRVITRGSGTNDWRRYPPGFVDSAEDAVSWTTRALGARRQIEVEVVAHVAAPGSGTPLMAEFCVDGGRPDRMPLARRDDVWTGTADLELPSEAVAASLDVGVLLPGFDPDAGGAGEGAVRAGRDAIRALARRRLAAARPYDSERRGVPEPFLAETAAATAAGEDY